MLEWIIGEWYLAVLVRGVPERPRPPRCCQINHLLKPLPDLKVTLEG